MSHTSTVTIKFPTPYMFAGNRGLFREIRPVGDLEIRLFLLETRQQKSNGFDFLNANVISNRFDCWFSWPSTTPNLNSAHHPFDFFLLNSLVIRACNIYAHLGYMVPV